MNGLGSFPQKFPKPKGPRDDNSPDWLKGLYSILGFLAIIGFVAESGAILAWVFIIALALFPIWLFTC